MTTKQKQWQLYYLGYYDGQIDGIAGVNTRANIAEDTDDEDDDWWCNIRYFSRKEFACKCGRYCDGYPAQMQRGVVELADRAREELKGAGFVSSGLRCAQHNTNVGGISNSRHLEGKAIDLHIEGKSARQTLDWVQKQPEVRYAYAIEAHYVHMDIA